MLIIFTYQLSITYWYMYIIYLLLTDFTVSPKRFKKIETY